MRVMHTKIEASFDTFSYWYTTIRCKSMKKSDNKKVFFGFFFAKIKKKQGKGGNEMFEYQKMAILEVKIAITFYLASA